METKIGSYFVLCVVVTWDYEFIAGVKDAFFMEVQAAEEQIIINYLGYLDGDVEKYKVSIEKGQTLYFAFYVQCYGSGYDAAGNPIAAKYSIKDNEIATIGKTTGVITAKKVGTTVITIKYGGISKKCTLNVKKADNSNYTKFQGKELIKKIDELSKIKEINSKNRYTYLNTLRSINSSLSSIPAVMGEDNQVIVTNRQIFNDCSKKIRAYQIQIPTPEILKVSKATKDSITLKFKNKITDDEIFKYIALFDSGKVNKKTSTAVFPEFAIKTTKDYNNNIAKYTANTEGKLTLGKDTAMFILSPWWNKSCRENEMGHLTKSASYTLYFWNGWREDKPIRFTY